MDKTLRAPVLPEMIRDAILTGMLPASIRPLVDVWWRRLSAPAAGCVHTQSFPRVRSVWPLVDALAAKEPALVREGVIAAIRQHRPILFEAADEGYLEGVLAVSGGGDAYLCALIKVEGLGVPGTFPHLVVDPVGVVLIGNGSGAATEIEWSDDDRHRNLKRPPSQERLLHLTRVIAPIVLGHGAGAARFETNHIPPVGRA